MTVLFNRGLHRKKRKKNPMTKHWTVLITASLATLLAMLAPAPSVHADIFQWQYFNPANPSQGKQPSTILCPDGAGVYAGQGANLSNRNLTMAYLIGADFSTYLGFVYDASGIYVGGYYSSNLTAANLTQADLTNANFGGAWWDFIDYPGANLTGANLSQANLTNANFADATLAGANLTGAEVRGATLSITTVQLYSTDSYLAHDLSGIKLSGAFDGVNLANQNLAK